MKKFGLTRVPKFVCISSHQLNPCTKLSLADFVYQGGRRLGFVRVFRAVLVLQTLGISAY